MSSIDSPSEIRPTAVDSQDLGLRNLVLPPSLAGMDATGRAVGSIAGAASETLSALRRFHLSGVTTAALDEDLLPAYLYAAAHTNAAVGNLMLLLGRDAEISGAGGVYLLWPLFTERLGKSLTESNGNSVLGGRIEVFQQCVHELLEGTTGAVTAHGLLVDAGRELQDRLGLSEDLAESLQQDVARICEGWGEEARILPPSNDAYLQLLIHVARDVYCKHRSSLHQQMEQLSELLSAFLAVEASKDDRARDATNLRQTMGSVGSSFLDTSELSKLLGPWRGAERLPQEQRQRAEGILATLRQALQEEDAPYVVLIHDRALDTSSLQNEAGCEIISHEDPCCAANDLFEERAGEAATLFRDMHIAHLLLENRYDPARHDPWFERFNHEGFTPEEFFYLPSVVAVDTAERLADDHLASLSGLLLSGKPIQVVAWQSPWRNPARADLLSGFRLELGYLGVGHRKSLVQQGSMQQVEHLVDGYRHGLESPHPALHVLVSEQPSTADPALAWLRSEAAILGRAHPLFCYNPDAGSTWARRMDFSGNPDPREDWPQQVVPVETTPETVAQWSLPSTFADFALLEDKLRNHFTPVPDDCQGEDLVRLDIYLQQPVEEASHCIPWIWASDAAGSLCRLVVSRHLVQACRDRLDYWHTLQELAGIRNQYVEDAVETAREVDRQAHEVERLRQAAQHAAEVESLERQTVKESMRRLSRMLLDLDPLAALAADTLAPDVTESEAAPEINSVTTEIVEAESEEEEEFDEPWIEAVLCTSCNDCLDINPKLFVYNDNKQAYIGEARSGTFAQLVQAAEKCPANCIHPGNPLNPQEPNLESLIQRAAPFN